ncbi:hypothetical protein VNO80_16157 [Phaseolus coccineus]|uniref:Uncharacterized protein n=1 Tax=Phaseolus coccineus TaxID=3886 RepID=A0AAN9MLY3_PHACN
MQERLVGCLIKGATKRLTVFINDIDRESCRLHKSESISDDKEKWEDKFESVEQTKNVDFTLSFCPKIMYRTSLITGTNFAEVGQGKLWFRKLHAMKTRISVKAMETLGLIWGMSLSAAVD